MKTESLKDLLQRSDIRQVIRLTTVHQIADDCHLVSGLARPHQREACGQRDQGILVPVEPVAIEHVATHFDQWERQLGLCLAEQRRVLDARNMNVRGGANQRYADVRNRPKA